MFAYASLCAVVCLANTDDVIERAEAAHEALEKEEQHQETSPVETLPKTEPKSTSKATPRHHEGTEPDKQRAEGEGWALDLSTGIGILTRGNGPWRGAWTGTSVAAGRWLGTDTALMVRLGSIQWLRRNDLIDRNTRLKTTSYLSSQTAALTVGFLHWFEDRLFVNIAAGPAAIFTFDAATWADDDKRREREVRDADFGVAGAFRVGVPIYITDTGNVLTISLETQPTFFNERDPVIPLSLTGGFQIF